MSSGKWRSFHLDLNVSTQNILLTSNIMTWSPVSFLVASFACCVFLSRNAEIHLALQRRHNERDGVSNHQRLNCLLKCWLRHRSKKTSKLRVTGLCVANSPVTNDRPVNSPHKRPVTLKCFHLMTSSWRKTWLACIPNKLVARFYTNLPKYWSSIDKAIFQIINLNSHFVMDYDISDSESS